MTVLELINKLKNYDDTSTVCLVNYETGETTSDIISVGLPFNKAEIVFRPE